MKVDVGLVSFFEDDRRPIEIALRDKESAFFRDRVKRRHPRKREQAARPENPADFAQRAPDVLDEAERVGGERDVEDRVVQHGEVLRVGLQEVDCHFLRLREVAANLTRRVNVAEANGSQVEEINEFLVPAATPGRRVNESSAFLRPQISAVYNTLQIRRGSGCMPTNGTCDPMNITWEQRVLWEHQVLEIRFLRLLEFGDSDGDGGYTPGEPILSQLDLADPAFHFAAVVLEGQNLMQGSQALPVRIHYLDYGWEGWLRQN